MRKISIETVRAAVPRVYPVVTRTPLIRLDPLSKASPEIFLKLEVFQPIGSFKIRGAMNAVASHAAARDETDEVKFCAIDDPGCEACQ